MIHFHVDAKNCLEERLGALELAHTEYFMKSMEACY